jgi:hypothetical protein
MFALFQFVGKRNPEFCESIKVMRGKGEVIKRGPWMRAMRMFVLLRALVQLAFGA